MKYKQFKILAVSLIINSFAAYALSIYPIPQALEKALQQAGANRPQLETVLQHYRQDKEKYQAACFLIENMQYHRQGDKVEYYDPQINTFRCQADRLYYALIKGKTDKEVKTKLFLDALAAIDTPHRDSVAKYPYFCKIIINSSLNLQIYGWKRTQTTNKG